MAGRAHVGVDLTVSSVSPGQHLGVCSPGCAQWPENLHLNPKSNITLCIFEHVQ